MILRRPLHLTLLTTALLVLTASATIKGDKELEEPAPLPPRPLPISVNPTISRSITDDDDDDHMYSKPEHAEGYNSAGMGTGSGMKGAVASSEEVRLPVVGSGKTSEEDVGLTTLRGPTHVETHATSEVDPHDLEPVPPVKVPDSAAAIVHLDPTSIEDAEVEGLITPMHSFGLSFLMIIFSEIGDKTFLIAALMAMKHPRLLVFSAAFSSLIVMSILSAVLGHAVPTLIPKKLTNYLAAGLFLVFGAKMIVEGLKMEKGTGSVQEEMKEVEQELSEKEAEARGRSQSVANAMEEGRLPTKGGRSGNPLRRSTSSPALSDSEDDSFSHHGHPQKTNFKSAMDGVQNLAGLLLSPAWVQTFVMTFLGEWGDRSQIATIAMAAGQDYWFVTLGAISGHALCTAGAVIGGKLLAEKISVRNVTLGGAFAFLAFGIIYGFEAVWT